MSQPDIPAAVDGKQVSLTTGDADLTGLQEDHSNAIGKSWHPFGHHDEHQKASESADNEADQSAETGKDGEHEDKPRKGALSGLVTKFKEMGNAMRGDKSHRFSDLLHLHREVKRDLSDATRYPELEQDAALRRTNALSEQEAAFIAARKRKIIESGTLHRFLQLDPSEVIHPDDVPVIGLGGSGGGYRACLGFLAYIEEMQSHDQHPKSSADSPSTSDLWDLCTYVAGVSGSCWSIAGLYSISQVGATALLDRFATSSAHHPLSMTAIDAVARSANGVYFQLAPILQKIRVGHLHPGPLDLYGTLVTSHIFFQPDEIKKTSTTADKTSENKPRTALQRDWFRFSKTYASCHLDQGAQPLPILTAVRHERPWRDWKSPEEAFGRSNHQSVEHQDAERAWWQWFEFTPIEFGSDELQGWIPTWSFGRVFKAGKSVQRLPERSLSLLLGICTSAPAGPLAAWLATIYRNLPKGSIGNKIRSSADEWVEAHPRQAERLQAHHPVHAMNEPNPFFKAEKKEHRGQGFENSPRIHMVDAGMSNNLPHYAFFRPGRNVDVMLLCDFSSDVQSGAALERIATFGQEKGVRITPRNADLADLPPWPQEEDPETKKMRNKELSEDEIRQRFQGRYAQVLDVEPIDEAEKERLQKLEKEQGVDGEWHVGELGILYNGRHQPQATASSKMIYMPLLPNACQPSYDPSTAAFSSSYNLVWTQEQVETIRKTSRANVVEAVETIRSVLRETYEAKRNARLAARGASGDKPPAAAASS